MLNLSFTQISLEAIKNIRDFEVNEEFTLLELLGSRSYGINDFKIKKVEKYLVQLIQKRELRGLRYDLTDNQQLFRDEYDNVIFIRIPNDFF